jgi:hypothetical protein
MTDVLVYSNPRKQLEIDDWPYGARRTKASFSVEANGGKERAVRVPINPTTGRLNKPSKMTYATKVVFVDGSDGRLYILEKTDGFKHLTVMRSTFDYSEEVIYSTDARYEAILALLGAEL